MVSEDLPGRRPQFAVGERSRFMSGGLGALLLEWFNGWTQKVAAVRPRGGSDELLPPVVIGG